MAFPRIEYRTDPIRDSEADAILVALPPLDAEDSPVLTDWPGLKESLSAIGFTDAPKPRAALVVVHGSAAPDPDRLANVAATADAVALVKDLVSIPAEWLGP